MRVLSAAVCALVPLRVVRPQLDDLLYGVMRGSGRLLEYERSPLLPTPLPPAMQERQTGHDATGRYARARSVLTWYFRLPSSKFGAAHDEPPSVLHTDIQAWAWLIWVADVMIMCARPPSSNQSSTRL